MNILLSSYSVNPYKGSEDAVGWNWTVTLSKMLPKANLFLVTKKFNEADTRKGLEELGLKNVKLIIVDVPDCLNWFREKHSAFHHMYYMLWQKYAYKWAKNSGIKFDIVHHITMGNYRITGSMYKLDAYSIFGPVGGGQTTPKSLKCYYKSQKIYESYRDLVNGIFLKLPSYKRKIRSFDKVYAVNKETKIAIQNAASINCDILPEIAINEELMSLEIEHTEKDCIEIIYLGRFIELKGLMLLLDVIKQIKTDNAFHFTLYGSGELENDMKQRIKDYQIEDIVSIGGEINHNDISNIYSSADIFVHPTFRDSAGVVFVEAMAHKLPLVALNQSFSSELCEHGCGLFVNTNQSKEEIIKEFAENIATLIEDSELRRKLGENGYKYANEELTVAHKFDIIYRDITDD